MTKFTLFIKKPLVQILTLALLQSHSLLSQAVVALQYHHIDTSTPSSTSTSPALFKQHIEFLVNNDFTVASLPTIVDALKAKETIKDKTVAITFDDGFISVYTNAFPILKAHSLPFTVFVNTDPIHANRPSHVSWDQLKEMKQHGATIANHTHKHSHLINAGKHSTNHDNSELSSQEWREAFKEEVNTAQNLLESKLNQDIRLFAYPYGEFDQQSNQLLKEMGYIGFGQHSGAIGADMDLQSLPRYPASNQYGKFPLIATKLNSIAFEKIEFKPEHGVIDYESENPPELYIYGDKASLNNINCFGSSVGVLPKINVDSTTLLIKPEHPFKTRRFRYNCTAKSSETGHFRWISIPWVNLTVGIN